MISPHHTYPDEDVHLSDYWRILKRHKVTALTVFVVIVIAVTIKTLLTTPVYRSTVTLFIDQESSNVLTVSDTNLALGAQSYQTYKEYFQSQKEIILSRNILAPVFYELGLDKTIAYATNDQTGPSPWSVKIRNFLSDVTGMGPAQTVPDQPMSSDHMDDFRRTIAVEEVPGTRLLRLSVEHTDPQLAAEIANRIAQR
ncbi:MAG: hypothetical protein K8L97_09305, partial [Anaerolineae bacterium]|nr:hypothetical protein [Anaerolineae bacterium]